MERDLTGHPEESMLSLHNGPDSKLVWLPVTRGDRYVLCSRAGGDPYATLTRERGSVVAGVSAEGSWTFRREGFHRVRVTTRTPDGEQEFATFQLGRKGEGLLETIGGSCWAWFLRGFWRQEHEFLHTEREPVVTVRPDVAGKIQVNVARLTQSLPELPVLAMLGAYLALMARDETVTMMTALTAGNSVS
jgi:hypothetical protein